MNTNPTQNADYERLVSSLAEGLWAGDISTEDKARADARHLIGWLTMEGFRIVEAEQIDGSGALAPRNDPPGLPGGVQQGETP